MILLIDNYDSFVYNLARHFNRLGQDTLVLRNDDTTVTAIQQLEPRAVVISPGPGTPRESGISVTAVQELVGSVPILGVCLGHQVIAAALGAQVTRAAEPMHGRVSEIEHNGRELFAGLPNPLTVCRYHSLVVDAATIPAELQITSRTADGAVMSFSHRQAVCIGVQFHPEAILTRGGYLLLANFLQLAGRSVINVPGADSELRTREESSADLPGRPVTF